MIRHLFSWTIAALPACSLVYPLSDLTTGVDDPVPPDAADSSFGVDSDSDAENDVEASTEADATADGSLPHSYVETVKADEPIGYWRFGEASGTTATNESGGAAGTYDGVGLGTDGAIVGDSNKAATFNGSGSYVYVANAYDFPGTQAFSIEVWVKPSSLSGTRRIVSHRTTGSSPTGYRLALKDSSIEFDRINSGSISGGVAVAAMTSTGQWAHIVGTYDGGQLRLYLDGVAVSNVASTGSIVASSADLVFGAASGGEDYFFSGVLDEVAIYDHALTAERVGAHKAASGR